MKSFILTLALMTMGSSAFADGFVCNDTTGALRIKVYHETEPVMGTRNAAIMILSNPSQDSGKTIATFSSKNALLASQSADYTADVDLRFTATENKNAPIDGTILAELAEINLDVDYSFSNPVPAGTPVTAQLTLVTRTSSNLPVSMTCTRYLKGQ
jgi:hypothetical protein